MGTGRFSKVLCHNAESTAISENDWALLNSAEEAHLLKQKIMQNKCTDWPKMRKDLERAKQSALEVQQIVTECTAKCQTWFHIGQELGLVHQDLLEYTAKETAMPKKGALSAVGNRISQFSQCAHSIVQDLPSIFTQLEHAIHAYDELAVHKSTIGPVGEDWIGVKRSVALLVREVKFLSTKVQSCLHELTAIDNQFHLVMDCTNKLQEMINADTNSWDLIVFQVSFGLSAILGGHHRDVLHSYRSTADIAADIKSKCHIFEERSRMAVVSANQLKKHGRGNGVGSECMPWDF